MNFPCFSCVTLLLTGQVVAESSIEAYFHNDSVNGFKLSDAYETHNMGLIYVNDAHYINLDLGIVSPDMRIYRNSFRERNRSFGEIVSLEIGEKIDPSLPYSKYLTLRASDEFGLDKAQDFAHKLLSLQRVNELNDLVRMPGAFWWGIGLRKEISISWKTTKKSWVDLDVYAGTDRVSFKVNFAQTYSYKTPLIYDVGAGLELVAYDKVVSSAPIFADERHLIPSFYFGLSYDFGAYSLYVKDKFSLPTITSDDDLFGVLSAGLKYKF